MPDKNTAADLADIADIATDVLVAIFKRRAQAAGMTVPELLAATDANWDKSDAEIEVLRNLGHE